VDPPWTRRDLHRPHACRPAQGCNREMPGRGRDPESSFWPDPSAATMDRLAAESSCPATSRRRRHKSSGAPQSLPLHRTMALFFPAQPLVGNHRRQFRPALVLARQILRIEPAQVRSRVQCVPRYFLGQFRAEAGSRQQIGSVTSTPCCKNLGRGARCGIPPAAPLTSCPPHRPAAISPAFESNTNPSAFFVLVG